MITTERLRELFDYLPETGELVRKVTTSHNALAGSVAGTKVGGRVFVGVDGKKYRAHRLIWMWHGHDLPDRLDHRNREPMHNRIQNLRPCTNEQNGWNAKLSKANTSGVKGVSWNSLSSNWRVRIRVSGRNISVGCFGDFELAELVSIEARAKFHGDFANAH